MHTMCGFMRLPTNRPAVVENILPKVLASHGNLPSALKGGKHGLS